MNRRTLALGLLGLAACGGAPGTASLASDLRVEAVVLEVRYDAGWAGIVPCVNIPANADGNTILFAARYEADGRAQRISERVPMAAVTVVRTFPDGSRIVELFVPAPEPDDVTAVAATASVL